MPPFGWTKDTVFDIIRTTDESTFPASSMLVAAIARYGTSAWTMKPIVNAFLLVADYTDGANIEIAMNPEFGTQEKAEAKALRFVQYRTILTVSRPQISKKPCEPSHIGSRTSKGFFRQASRLSSVGDAGSMPMTGRAERHSLSDWLALHELDPAACCRILDALARQAASVPVGHKSALGSYALDPEAAWLRTADAMRAFFPAQRSIIDDTFEKTVRTLVSARNKSRRALTYDNGPTTYPTILYSYQGKPSDSLVIAHEFGHALQIRASRGKFVSPIIREVCAFIGEMALLSHERHSDIVHYRHLFQVWHRDNQTYFGTGKNELTSAFLEPEMPYSYSWNYPIARYLTIQISQRCSRDRMWTLFEGDLSVAGALRELDYKPSAV